MGQPIEEAMDAVKSSTLSSYAIVLTVVAFKYDDTITWEPVTVFLVGLSLLPAPVSLCVLWFDADRQLKPMKQEADALEKRASAAL
jgi:hypothetical protein